MNKRLVVPVILAIIAVPSSLLAYNRGSMTITKHNNGPSIDAPAVQSTTVTSATDVAPTPSPDSTVATTAGTSTVPSSPATPAPLNPYQVADKVAALTAAGVPSDQLTTAQSLIDSLTGGVWIYKNDSGSVNLCNVYPAAKMSSAGADYADNPVTQLKWCSAYVVARYGSWDAALAGYKTNGSI